MVEMTLSDRTIHVPPGSHGYDTNILNGKHAVTCAFATGYCELPPFVRLVSGLARVAQTLGVEQSVWEDDFVNVFPVAASRTLFASVVGALLQGYVAQ